MRAPITVPAIAAIENPPSAGADAAEVVAVGAAEVLVADAGFLVARVEVAEVEVAVADVVVDAGEFAFRQVASSVIPTVLTSEAPPCLPAASIIMNTMDVPLRTLAVQSKDVGPACGLRMTAVPPGTIPCGI